ncbi:hypothetical protein BDV95DRAFT_586519 [Massariosphaeria phaeospora]|uniref:Secreted protein n=1 Tax=Massariosphaeria phaeospora TaxID=100035 RepID=A0A7C8M0X0_9PLEO|nr:hypothetical protein BDV95DRAFT_586519 [Massariosphaeria phaeospora]
MLFTRPKSLLLLLLLLLVLIAPGKNFTILSNALDSRFCSIYDITFDNSPSCLLLPSALYPNHVRSTSFSSYALYPQALSPPSPSRLPSLKSTIARCAAWQHGRMRWSYFRLGASVPCSVR